MALDSAGRPHITYLDWTGPNSAAIRYAYVEISVYDLAGRAPGRSPPGAVGRTGCRRPRDGQRHVRDPHARWWLGPGREGAAAAVSAQKGERLSASCACRSADGGRFVQ